MCERCALLVVEDERQDGELLRRGLLEEGYAVDVALDGRAMRSGWRPRPSTTRSCSTSCCPASTGSRSAGGCASEASGSPVLMLTARDAVEDRVAGLDGGADDYLTEAVRVRRAARAPARARAARPDRAAGRARGRRRSGSIRRRGGSGAATPRSSSRPRSSRCSRRSCGARARCSRASTCSSTRGIFAYENRSNVVDVYVRYLRDKIDRPFGVRSIETVRGVGLPPARGRRHVSRIPIRLRLTLVFALAMAVVLAGDGALRLPPAAGRQLDGTIDDAPAGARRRRSPRWSRPDSRRLRAPPPRSTRTRSRRSSARTGRVLGRRRRELRESAAARRRELARASPRRAVVVRPDRMRARRRATAPAPRVRSNRAASSGRRARRAARRSRSATTRSTGCSRSC